MTKLPPLHALFRSSSLLAADGARRRLLQSRLETAGLEPAAYAALRDVEGEGERALGELVIVDFVADGRDGLAACRELQRQGYPAPVVGVFGPESLGLLTPQVSLQEVLVEPFSDEELHARLALLAWRRLGVRGTGVIAVGEVVVDPVRHLVTERGRSVQLTAKEYQLLRFLAAHRGTAFGRATLLARREAQPARCLHQVLRG